MRSSSSQFGLGLLACLLAATGASVAAADLTESSGAQLFYRFCSSCHGRSGEGDGPVAPLFKLQPPDLTQLTRRNGGTFPAERTRQVIDGRQELLPHGTRKMPVWGREFEQMADRTVPAQAASQTSIQRLVEHLRSIQK
jgi:mono/diheme cytochrome c family protein